MTISYKWLPPLILFETYSGDWDQYKEALYKYFKQDFVESSPLFRGIKLALKRHPVIDNKEATFWHLISEGKIEEDRVPDFRRCERIRWPRPIIEHSNETVVKVWENTRNGEKRICLWIEDEEYLVVLAKRKGYLLLWTAYLVTRNHQKRKLEREYEVYKNANAAP